MSEKETYFDGPHMSSANSQSQFNSVLEQRSTSGDGPPLYNSVHSNFFPISSQDVAVTASSSSLKFSTNTEFYQFNGQENQSDFAPSNHFQQPQFDVPNEGNDFLQTVSSSVSDVGSSQMTVQNNFSIQASTSHQAATDHESNQPPPVPMFSANVGSTLLQSGCSATSQPVGTYMNIAYGVDQQNVVPMMSNQTANFQPIHSEPEVTYTDQGVNVQPIQSESEITYTDQNVNVQPIHSESEITYTDQGVNVQPIHSEPNVTSTDHGVIFQPIHSEPDVTSTDHGVIFQPIHSEPDVTYADQGASFQPIHSQLPGSAASCSFGKPTRAEQLEHQNDQLSIHPLPFSDLHQSTNGSRNRRHPDDILHSQGTWPNQSYNTSSADSSIQNQSSFQSFIPLDHHDTDQNKPEEGSIRPELNEALDDDLARIGEQMNNLALSEHESPVCVEELNIREETEVSDDSDSESLKETKEDEVVVEEIAVSSSDPIGLEKMSPDLDLESSNADLSLSTSRSAGSNIETSSSSQAVGTTSDASDTNVSSAVEITEVLEPDNAKEENLLALRESEFLGSRSNDKESANNDAAISRLPVESLFSSQSNETPSRDPRDQVSSNQTSTVRSDMQPSVSTERSSIDVPSAVDTVSMHSSYVSVNPSNLPLTNIPFSGKSPSMANVHSSADLPPNSAPPINVVAPPESRVREPSPHALHSQMVSHTRFNETTSQRLPETSSVSSAPQGYVKTSSRPNPDPESRLPLPPHRNQQAEAATSTHNRSLVRSTRSPVSHPGYQVSNIAADTRPNFGQAPPTSHVIDQSTNRRLEDNRYNTSMAQPNPDPTLYRSFNQPQDKRQEPTRNPSRPHSSMSAHEPHYSSGDASGWRESGPGWRENDPGRWRDDRFDRDYRRWSRDPRLHDYHGHQYHSRNPDRHGYSDYQYYGRYPEHYGYDRRRYNEGYDYYGEPGYYEQSIERYDGYDRSIRHHRFPNYYDDYYSHGYGRGPYYDEDSRSVYSERSAGRHPVNDTYDASYQDMSHSRGFLDESSMVDSSYPLPSSDGAHQQQHQLQPQVSARMTPAKFSCAHPIALFGPGGVLITIMPQPSADRNTSSVQIHSVETLLQKTKEAENFNRFPGPLSKSDTHKNDVLQFTKLQIRRSTADTSLIDRESTRLVWEFLDLMVRQNGAVLGTDIAELLMRNHSGDFGLLPSPNETQEVEHAPEASSSTHPEMDLEYDDDASEAQLVSTSDVHASKRFRELLLYGRRKDALEWAMRSSLWGHALLLASKTDARTHATVMLRFANSLPINDPLQTLYQMMSGRQPASTTLIADEGWGSWRPHLAMILSNATENVSFDTKLLLTMGDTLCTRGLIDAAHFCYLMASMPLGYYSKKSSKLVLIGSSHARNFKEFSNSESIERSEIYEYAIALSTSSRHRARHIHIPALQIFKFIYACRLMDAGLITKAFHYFETIAKLVNSRPTAYSITFVRQLSALVDRLKPHDLRAQAGSLSESDLQWTHTLNANLDRMQDHLIHPSSSCARTSSPSDVTSSVDDARHPDDDDDDDDDDTSCSIESEEEEDDDDKYEPGPSSRPQVSFYDKNSMQHLGGPPLQVHPPPAAPAKVQHYPSSIYHTSSGFSSVPHSASSFPPMMQPTSAPPSSQHFPDTVLPPLVGANPQQPYIAHPSLPTSQTRTGHSMNPIDHELSQASMPVMYNPNQLSTFQPQNQFSSTPNTSIPFSPPQLPPSSNQASPPGDIYDHIANHSPEFESRVRSESQTSYGSRRSRLSRKSTGKRSRTLSERSRASVASEKEEKPKSSKGWSLFNWFKKDDKPKAHRVHLPDDSKKDIQWDPNLKRWVDANATEEEMAPPEPPPMDSALPPSTTPIGPAGGPPGNGTLTRNKYSLKSLSSRTMYKNAFSSSTSTSAPSVMAPSVLPTNTPGNIFVPTQTPSSVPASMENSSEQLQTTSQDVLQPSWKQAVNASQQPPIMNLSHVASASHASHQPPMMNPNQASAPHTPQQPPMMNPNQASAPHAPQQPPMMNPNQVGALHAPQQPPMMNPNQVGAPHAPQQPPMMNPNQVSAPHAPQQPPLMNPNQVSAPHAPQQPPMMNPNRVSAPHAPQQPPMMNPNRVSAPHAPQQLPMMNPNQVSAPHAPQQLPSLMNSVSQVSHSTNGFAPPASAPTPHLPSFQPSTHSSLQPSVTHTGTSSATDQMAAPPMATFYNPASFGGGVNAFSQSTRGAGRGKRGYPSVRR